MTFSVTVGAGNECVRTAGKHPSILHRDPVIEAIALLKDIDTRLHDARLFFGRTLPLRHELADYIDMTLQQRLARHEKEDE